MRTPHYNREVRNPSDRKRPSARTFILLGASLSVLAILAIEGFFRFVEPPLLRTEATPAWVGNSHYSAAFKRGYPTVDGNTFRNVRPFEERSSRSRVAFLGDAHVMSSYDGDELWKSIGGVAESSLRETYGRDLEVLNFGLSSTGMVHHFVRYEKIVLHYEHDLVVVFIHDNDGLDSSEANPNPLQRPHYLESATGEIKDVRFEHDEIRERLRRLARKSALYRFLRFRGQLEFDPESEAILYPSMMIYAVEENPIRSRAYDQLFRWTLRLHDRASEAGKKVLFVYLPARQVSIEGERDRWERLASRDGVTLDFDFFGTTLSEFMEDHEYDYVSLLDRLGEGQLPESLYLPLNLPGGPGFGHLNDQGNRVVGEFLAHLIDQRLDPRPRSSINDEGERDLP